MAEHVIALTTLGSEDDAVRLARALLERRLVACVNVLPSVRSLYLWKGTVADEREHLCVMKTRADRSEALRSAVAELHPYEVPELVLLEIAGGATPYLEWIDACLGPQPSSR